VAAHLDGWRWMSAWPVRAGAVLAIVILGLLEHAPISAGPLATDRAALDFYTAILAALARQYAADYPPAGDMPIYELLDTLINDLRAADQLR
jgi:hypothetical protein